MMQPRSTPNYISESLLCLALMAGGLWFGAYNMTANRGKPIAPIAVVAGAAVAYVGYERSRRCNLGIQHYSEGLNTLFDDLDSILWSWVKQSKPVVKRVVPVHYLPERFQSFAAAQLERMVDDDWVPGFLKRSKLVCGVTRSGKTTFFLHEIANFFERYPDGHLTICDLNYGKPDEDGNINTWFDLPRDRFVRVCYEEIYDSIKGEWEELERRKKVAIANASGPKKPLHFQRRKLLIDEVIAVINEAKRRDKQKPSGEPKELPYLQSWIGDLLYQGLGYQLECTFGLQSMAVGENGLNLAMQEQLNVLLLGATAINTQNVARLPGIRDAVALIDKLKQIRSQPGCKYAAIAKIGTDEPTIKIIPHIDVSQIELQLPQIEMFSAEEMWWVEACTDEFYQWMKEQAIAYVNGGKSPLKAIAKKLGIETRANDPKYKLFKESWDQLLVEVKELL